MRTTPAIALSLALSAALACSRGGDDEARKRLVEGDPGAPAAPAGPAAPRTAEAPFDPARPLAALALDADEVARRLGSFEWTAGVDWKVARGGEAAAQVRAAERHRLRQLATGEFALDADLDPGLGPGSEAGKEIVFTGGTTYARARGAPFRERPTDRGRDARLYRDESFGAARDVAALLGPALRLEPAGEATALGRRALRYRASLQTGAEPAPVPARTFPGGGKPDEDTARRLAFLDGRVPRAADGELLLDAATGAPLVVRLAASFGVREAPAGVTADVELLAQVKAIGRGVAPVKKPDGVLPDVRKPPGVAGALEAAGLRKPAAPEGEAAARPEPADAEE
jgi:hypothetical protein